MSIPDIVLYDEPAVPEIRLEKLAGWLRDELRVRVEVLGNVFGRATGATAAELASARVINPRRPFVPHVPREEEIEAERAYCEDSSGLKNIIYYDGFELQRIVSGLVRDDALGTLHIAFTNRLTCTYDDGDCRYHGRALIGAGPSIISTTGMVEAPAKPREYYVELISGMTRGLNVDAAGRRYAGSCLAYHDARLSDVTRGYLLQSILYYSTGDAFCDRRDCRLYNAHWQADLLYSQLESARLCEKHQGVLDRMRPVRKT